MYMINEIRPLDRDKPLGISWRNNSKDFLVCKEIQSTTYSGNFYLNHIFVYS